MSESVMNKPRSNSTLVILLVVVVLILIGVVAFLLLGGSAVTGLLNIGGSGYAQDQFIVSMNKLVLRPQDMSTGYKIAAGGDLHMDNSQLTNNMGSAYAKPFIQNTGRVDGWDVSMERVDNHAFAPEFVRSRVEYYSDAGGASDALSKDWFWAYQMEDRMPDEFISENCRLGSDCLLFKYSEAKPGAGNIIERYDVAFRTQNVVIWVYIKGVQGEVSADLVMDYGQMVMDKVNALTE